MGGSSLAIPPTLYKPNAVTTPLPRLAHHTGPYCHVLATVRITNVKDGEGTLIETEGTPGHDKQMPHSVMESED